jgi:gelsolin
VNKQGNAAPPRPASGPPVCVSAEVPNTASGAPRGSAPGGGRSKPPPPSTPSPAALALQQEPNAAENTPAGAEKPGNTKEEDPFPGVSTAEHPTSLGEDENPPPDNVYFNFAHLNSYPAELDRADLPRYLTPEDFKLVFAVEKAAFYKLPAWKQGKVKQGKALY